MKKIIISFMMLMLAYPLFAQDIARLLAEIEQNNTKLTALKKANEAERLENRTGIYLENPEFEFHYLWGNPTSMGQRTDISIKQSFDFPTVYGHQNKISDLKNEQIELKYIKEQKAIILQAKQILFQLVFHNAQQEQLAERLKHAQSIASSYQAKFKVGECNVLEYNKSQLSLLNLQKESESVKIEKESLLAELRSLNGGKEIVFENSSYELVSLPSDFEQWYLVAESNNPLLNWFKQEVELSQRQEKLSKAMSLPKLNAGYMSEKAGGQQFQGLIVGVSIPLWENKNTVKYAKANTDAMQSYAVDNKIVFYNHLMSLYEKAKSLQLNTEDYRVQLSKYEHSQLLKKALDKGQITLIDYMLELSIYYTSQNNLLEMERDLNLCLAELYQFM
ncbi:MULTISPECIES: TolC family protein [unclassified Lentimicrobium]|uniref:TolC family protein n=1 Tax=unclassified Lentimicrobium TaxID=2677434 RepID=UPI0015543EC4|nr:MULTISPECIES: TolC family protein [unclassified Lentimicrobium]NPD47060.1 TolC family protein [Lentimicrobium sp. S6]NPD84428.1 TolC family protein [Lentimicrobium sp. L6]